MIATVAWRHIANDLSVLVEIDIRTILFRSSAPAAQPDHFVVRRPLGKELSAA